jgi:hypothetical protein
MTWKLVTTWPSSSQTKPDPLPRDLREIEAESAPRSQRGDKDDRGRRVLEELDGRALALVEVAGCDRTLPAAAGDGGIGDQRAPPRAGGESGDEQPEAKNSS